MKRKCQNCFRYRDDCIDIDVRAYDHGKRKWEWEHKGYVCSECRHYLNGLYRKHKK